MKDKKKPHIIEKRVGTATIAAIAAVSMVISNLFGAPTDLMITKQEAPAPITVQAQLYDDDTGDDSADDEENGDDEETESVPKGVRARIRKWILDLPIGVRASIGVPLWCIGYVLNSLLGTLWSFILSPILGGFLRWLCLTIITMALAAVLLKLLFPNIPWRKLFTKKSFISAIVFSAICWIFDTIAPHIWSEYEKVSKIVEISLFTVLPTAIVGCIYQKHKKRRIEA